MEVNPPSDMRILAERDLNRQVLGKGIDCMNRELYQEAEMEIIEIQEQDVVTTSGDIDLPDDNWDQ